MMSLSRPDLSEFGWKTEWLGFHSYSFRARFISPISGIGSLTCETVCLHSVIKIFNNVFLIRRWLI